MGILKKILLPILAALVMVMGAPAAAAQGDTLNQGNAFQQQFRECMDSEDGYLPDTARDFLTDNFGGLGDSLVGGDKRFMCLDTAATENPGGALAAGAGNITSAFWGDAVGDFTKAVLEGNAQALQAVMTLWMDFRIDGGVVDAQIQGVKNITWGLAAIFLVLSLIVGGGRIAAARRQGLTDEVLDSGSVVVRYLIFSLAVPAAVPGALLASDVLSEWIMTSFGASDQAQIFDAATLNESMAGPVLMLVLAAVSLAGSVMQIIALAVRVLLLPLVAGLAPLFAAASFSDVGRGAVQSMVGWLIAAVAFKPVASLLYSVAFWVISDIQSGQVTGLGEGTVLATIMCALLLALAGFTAPALMRVIAPMVSAAGGSGAGPVVASGAAMGSAAMGMAGAAMMRGGGSAAAKAAAGGSPAMAAAATGGGLTGSGTGPGGGAAGGVGRTGGGTPPPSGGGGGNGRTGSGGGGATPSGASGESARSTARATPQGAGSPAGGLGTPAASRGGTVRQRAMAAGLTGSSGASVRQMASAGVHGGQILDDSVGTVDHTAAGPDHIRR